MDEKKKDFPGVNLDVVARNAAQQFLGTLRGLTHSDGEMLADNIKELEQYIAEKVELIEGKEN